MSDFGLNSTETIGSFAIACLKANGVDTVFGIPGTHNIELYRGILEYKIRHVLTRHEQGATYAADGYARATGRAGVVIATSGPGVTNCITGIANAYADSVPLLVLSPGAPRGLERRDLGFLHEAKDQRAGIDNFAAASIRVESKEALEDAINGTFLAFRTGRIRPVHIEIPTDLIEHSFPQTVVAPWEGTPPIPADNMLYGLIDELQYAERPLILAGGGSVNYSEKLTELAEITGIPVVTTLQGKGVVSEHHPLNAGALAGSSSGFEPIHKSDFVLAFGTELKNATLAHDASLARFDIDAGQLHKHVRSKFPVLGDLGGALDVMLSNSKVQEFKTNLGWQKLVQETAEKKREAAFFEWGKLHEAILDGIKQTVDSPVILTGDSSQISWLGTMQSAVLDGPRQFLTTDGYATLGYSLPAAIGAKVALPEAQVISIMGDGALLFSVQELATASEERLCLPIVVFDNGGYGEIRENMRDAGLSPLAVDFTGPNYEALGEAFGCDVTNVCTPEELSSAVERALTKKCPTIINILAKDFENPAWRSY